VRVVYRTPPDPPSTVGERELKAAQAEVTELCRRKQARELRGKAREMRKERWSAGRTPKPEKRVVRSPSYEKFLAASRELNQVEAPGDYEEEGASELVRGLLVAGVIGVGLWGVAALVRPGKEVSSD